MTGPGSSPGPVMIGAGAHALAIDIAAILAAAFVASSFAAASAALASRRCSSQRRRPLNVCDARARRICTADPAHRTSSQGLCWHRPTSIGIIIRRALLSCVKIPIL